MQTKPKYKWLERWVSKPGPYLTLCLSEDEQKHATKGLTDHFLRFPESGALCHTFTDSRNHELCAIVSVSHEMQMRAPIQIVGLLVHEAVHVWQAYIENMGEHAPGNEQEAYAIQAITQELLTEYARRLG